MAVTKTATKCTLQIKVETGTTASGATAYATRSLSVINPAITDADLYDLGVELGELQSLPVDGIGRVDAFSLISA